MMSAAGQSTSDGIIASSAQRIVVGLGDTGLSVVRYLAHRGERFAVVDTRDEPPGLAQLRDEFPDVSVFAGGIPQSLLNAAAELIVSPGLAPDLPFLQEAVAAGAVIRGDADLFVEAAQAPVIGITGSNAKSTVTALVGAMAQAAGMNAGVGGNLGPPALDLLADERDLYVLELSSFQLERSDSLNLAVACVLNLSADHLDRHGSMPRYHQAKHRIFRGCHHAVVNSDDPLTIPPGGDGMQVSAWRLREPDLHGFGIHRDDDGVEWLARGFDDLMPVTEIALAGRHNLANALAAVAIGHSAGLPMAAMLSALRDFQGLPHRCQLVAVHRGVRWVNDSKATNVGAARAAIEGMGQGRNLVLIAGGRGKGGDFTDLRQPVAAHCKGVLLIGETAGQLARDLGDAVPVRHCDSLQQAVQAAASMAVAGDCVLLSPACASFDMFRNYGERGDAFAAAVRDLRGGVA
ncbi:UDP-N-acetylmuramoyl-L-alanine--D-glutamate ligase [Chromatocurvus halotolerans]|uniref:UDP-N-acetylmuramoylalanine--D-glutamate ligase n=1 Tax=Chromatocurvus halotolerans TaxID=1132028 RepID=A0A4R2L0Y5_9GAMM|nr:UDP-N-acetylmuramoyl-L-alanine--D-glutamate ligase [Chromatocurvus halotolerans]TCO76198.1 UDP-N-acetylmuramoylalanine--D-glutamate ligase [Chromatocurvus halotolerans]